MILRDFIEWNNESFDKGYIPKSRIGMYILIKQCEGKETTDEQSNCIKPAVVKSVCEMGNEKKELQSDNLCKECYDSLP